MYVFMYVCMCVCYVYMYVSLTCSHVCHDVWLGDGLAFADGQGVVLVGLVAKCLKGSQWLMM
jgi:hypothetical protein